MPAERIEQLTTQIDELNQRLTRLGRTPCHAAAGASGYWSGQCRRPADHDGDDPRRLGTGASFAALCGVSPVEYSSGLRASRRRYAAREVFNLVKKVSSVPRHRGVRDT
ncbi:transposase [Streptomyces sp. enrichment culture]|uniref:transposase n=1 Tax=Streptomyces sp. enrichment culture TaxID=1795815 RepID=UPI003F580193